MTTLKTSPLAPRFGVIVHDVDLRDVRADHLFPEIRAAFDIHSALLFKGQDLDPESHIALASLFGPIEDRQSDERKPGEQFTVPEVTNMTAEGGLTGEMDLHTLHLKSNFLWHADSTFMPVPALCNILTAKVVTRTGGATELASTRAAFADMTAERQEALRGLRLRHHYSQSRARISPELAKLPMFHKWPETRWPAVWKNPVNGQEAVYVASHAFAVEGMEEEAGRALIDALVEDCTAPQYVYTHDWEVGDVLIWDQRAVLHRGRPWPMDEARKLASICVSVTAADGLDAMRAA
jgi:alpha-ketoglutarate-dependent 2,4-dichlorophenoxyacetate dioxygenase